MGYSAQLDKAIFENVGTITKKIPGIKIPGTYSNEGWKIRVLMKAVKSL
jgi:hypothetical protein